MRGAGQIRLQGCHHYGYGCWVHRVLICNIWCTVHCYIWVIPHLAEQAGLWEVTCHSAWNLGTSYDLGRNLVTCHTRGTYDRKPTVVY